MRRWKPEFSVGSIFGPFSYDAMDERGGEELTHRV